MIVGWTITKQEYAQLEDDPERVIVRGGLTIGTMFEKGWRFFYIDGPDYLRTLSLPHTPLRRLNSHLRHHLEQAGQLPKEGRDED